eukprot:2708831-Rhodomonas_salina.1
MLFTFRTRSKASLFSAHYSAKIVLQRCWSGPNFALYQLAFVVQLYSEAKAKSKSKSQQKTPRHQTPGPKLPVPRKPRYREPGYPGYPCSARPGLFADAWYKY